MTSLQDHPVSVILRNEESALVSVCPIPKTISLASLYFLQNTRQMPWLFLVIYRSLQEDLLL